MESAIGRPARWVQIDADDFNLDARKEIRMAGDRLVAFLAPSRGGHLYELDVRGVRLNLLGTLNRRPEAYHDVVRHAAHSQHDPNAVASIHEAVRFKQPDLDRILIYDNWPRKSLVDHFLPANIDPAALRNGDGEIGDFVLGVYETKLRRSPGRVEAVLSRDGVVGSHRIRLEKSIALEASAGNRLDIRYELSNLPPGERFHFAVEFNFAGLAAGASDRYFYDGSGRQLGQLESVLNLKQAERIGLVDEWLGIDVGDRTVARQRHLDVSHSDGEPVRGGLRTGAPIERRGAALGFPGRTRRALSRGAVADSRHVSRPSPRTLKGRGRHDVGWDQTAQRSPAHHD